MVTYLCLEMLRVLRTPRFLLLAVLMPVAFYLIFTNLGTSGGSSGGPATELEFMVSMACYGAIFAALSLVAGTIEDRTTGWMRQLRTTPLPAGRVVAAKLLTGMAVVLPTISCVCLAAVIDYGVQLDAGQWLALIVVLWVGAAPFALLGAAIGYLCTAQSSSLVNMAVVLGGVLLGGFWFPVSLLPGTLQHVAHALPFNRYADLGWQVVAGQAPTVTDAAVLLAWCAAFGALAMLGYRRVGRTV
jgi:ABC-2 type transport system permease protein